MGKTRDSSSDIIIVGSGPGGTTVAKELAGYGKKVLILEWAKYKPVKVTHPQAIGITKIKVRVGATA